MIAKKHLTLCAFQVVVCLLIAGASFAQNPLIRTMFSADPTARVFGDSVYVYPSHDILADSTRGRIGWFCMEDYHVFSSANLTDWKDGGVIVTQNKVPWVKENSYSMWAPDCVAKNSKYYFYFPTAPKDTTQYGRGFAIGVAIADKPGGPFVPQPQPIKGVHGIDPNIFIDKDGQAYIYYALGNLYVAKLKENMLELASEPQIIANLPDKGLKEGPFLFERNGLYYLTYPHVADKTEQLEYAIGKSPLGPFTVTSVIMDEHPQCWTNHQSIMPYKGQWYLFYHYNDYSPQFDKARSIRADSLFFNEDGRVKKVVPTERGIGITKASDTIQVDRYSAISESGVTVDFIDTANKFKGWKAILANTGAWVQYNTVDFGKKKWKTIYTKVKTSGNNTLQVRADGTAIAGMKIQPSNDWIIIKAPVSSVSPGIHNLIISAKDKSAVEIDWIRFE